FRAGEFDRGFLIARGRFVQTRARFLRGFDLGGRRCFDLDIDGRGRSEIGESLFVKNPAADADDGEAEKADNENGEAALGETSHARTRRRIVSGRGLDRRDRRGRRRWRRRLAVHAKPELVSCAPTFKLLKEEEDAKHQGRSATVSRLAVIGFAAVWNHIYEKNCRFCCRLPRRGRPLCAGTGIQDRKSTRLNSSHSQISYAV